MRRRSHCAPGAVRPAPRQVSLPGWLAIVGLPVALVAIAEALLGVRYRLFRVRASRRRPVPDRRPRRLSSPVLGAPTPGWRRRGGVGAGRPRALDRRRQRSRGATLRQSSAVRAGGDAGSHVARLRGGKPCRCLPLTATSSRRSSGTWCCPAPSGRCSTSLRASRPATRIRSPAPPTTGSTGFRCGCCRLVFALVGRFEDTMYCLRAVGSLPGRPVRRRSLPAPAAGVAAGCRRCAGAAPGRCRRRRTTCARMPPTSTCPARSPTRASLAPDLRPAAALRRGRRRRLVAGGAARLAPTPAATVGRPHGLQAYARDPGEQLVAQRDRCAPPARQRGSRSPGSSR